MQSGRKQGQQLLCIGGPTDTAVWAASALCCVTKMADHSVGLKKAFVGSCSAGDEIETWGDGSQLRVLKTPDLYSSFPLPLRSSAM